MADKLSLLRAQTQRYLTSTEAQSLKQALSRFTHEKSVRSLVASMSVLLNTVQKQRLYDTIGSIIPNHYRDEYVRAQEPLRKPFTREEAEQLRREEEEFISKRAAVRREAEAVDQTSSERARLREEGRRYLEEQRREAPSIDALKLSDSSLHQESLDYEFTDADIAALEEDDGPDSGEASGWLADSYMSDVHGRDDAEAMLQEAGMVPGSFLVRHLDLKCESIKPGATIPFRVLMLSVAIRSDRCMHVLLEQADSGTPILVDGKSYGQQCTDLKPLVEALRTQPAYLLTLPLYHCQPWYHGTIPEKAAEKLLSQGFAEGRFLVRREGNLFALSLCANGAIVHEKVFFKDGHWLVACAPLLPHPTLKALLAHHASTAGGLPVPLSRPCLRSRAPRAKPGEAGAPAVAAVGADGEVHAESHV